MGTEYRWSHSNQPYATNWHPTKEEADKERVAIRNRNKRLSNSWILNKRSDDSPLDNLKDAKKHSTGIFNDAGTKYYWRIWTDGHLEVFSNQRRTKLITQGKINNTTRIAAEQ